ncbi:MULTISPECIES: CsbD family protein [Planococcus]|uniref:CsbD-like protein n=1 Tax=Planococcus citreus TaxID=1373 RepID=A0A497YLM9_9BACL|nr:MULTISPECIES: CsbD family protein [Planococcus]MDE0584859.1 CsbD family protein [Planococcus sp. A6]RLJ90411.1 CsbD-like protein [Planococcus citreus]
MADKEGFSDKVKGAVSKGKGELKDQVGNATDNPDLQAEGKSDKTKGKVQDTVGKFKEGFNKDK